MCVHVFVNVNSLRGHKIFELCDGISSQKQKSSQNSFCLFIWGLGRIFEAKINGPRKSHYTVPLNRASSAVMCAVILKI